ncbi:hypothetical protein QUB17_24175 [Microcoleus sp. B5-C4]
MYQQTAAIPARLLEENQSNSPRWRYAPRKLRLTYYYDQLLNGGSQHLCHSAEKTICRGGRTITDDRWFYSLGIIEEPTDQAFNQAVAEIELKRNKNDGNTRNDGETENISETH